MMSDGFIIRQNQQVDPKVKACLRQTPDPNAVFDREHDSILTLLVTN